MGLQSELNDFSSNSIPLFLLSLLADFLSLLRSFLFSPISLADHALSSTVGSQSHHLLLNRLFSHRYGESSDDSSSDDCVVCLSSLARGEHVRRLSCRHVFHKHCFDAWLHHLNFNCPLCRSPLVSDERVLTTRRRYRVAEDLVAWFCSMRDDDAAFLRLDS